MVEMYKTVDVPVLPAPAREIVPAKPHDLRLKFPFDYSYTGTKINIQRALNRELASPVVFEHIVDGGDYADLAFSTHTLAKELKQAPQAIAEGLVATGGLNNLWAMQDAEAAGGYVNFKLNREWFGRAVVEDVLLTGDKYGHQNNGNGDRVIIDYSSPNIAKFMSVGHLRSTVIGESLSRIYQANGYEVITDNHLGDWGTQFGMLGKAYEMWADEVPELRDGTNPVKGLYNLYVRIHDEVAKQREPLEAPLKAQQQAIEEQLGKKKAKKDQGYRDIQKEINAIESPLERDGKDWFVKLEQGDPTAQELLEWSTKLSLAEFKKVYDLLGTRFHYTLGESAYVPMIPSMMSMLEQKGLVTTKPDGTKAFDLSDQGLPDLDLLKKDGRSVYGTRDVAALIARETWFNPDKIVYVVGEPQRDYFNQVFAAHHKINPEGPETEFVGFGTVTLPEGKMSTRAGRVVFLEDVLTEAIDRSRVRVNQSGHNMPQAEKETVAKQIGVGATIYFDLGQSRERDIKYDHDKALAMEGQSAPYIQYSYARTQAIAQRLEKAGFLEDPKVDTMVTTDSEFALVKELAKYPEAVNQAMVDNQPARIANAVYKIAEQFNQMYHNDRILGTEEPARTTRLRLSRCAGQVIKNGLDLLGIEAPARM